MSRARFRVRIALGVALLALAFAVVLLARETGGMKPAAPATPGREGASPELAPPPLTASTYPSPTSAAAHAGTDPPQTTPTPIRPALLSVRLRLATEGAPLPPEARVLLCPCYGEGPLRRAEPGPDGRFTMALDLGPNVEQETVRLAAVARGYAYVHEFVRVTAGEETEVSILLGGQDPGDAWIGRVLAPDDRPVPGLRFLLTSDPDHEVLGLLLRDPTGDGGGESLTEDVLAILVTDADGAFEVRGVPHGMIWPRSLDDRWHVERADEDDSLWGEAPILLRARPGFLLTARVVDAVTGEVLPRVYRSLRLLLGERDVGGSRTRGASGLVRWSEAIPPGGERGFQVACTFDAEGYRVAERRLDFGPGAWHRKLEVALERLRPEAFGRLRLVHELRDASGALLPLEVFEWRRHGTLSYFWPHDLEGPEPTLETRAGATRLTIQGFVSGATYPPAWEGEVTVFPGRTTEFSVPFPPTGILRLRAGRVPTVRTLDLFDAQGAGKGTLQIPADAETVDFPAFPVGSWSFGPAGDAAAPRTHFRIAADTVTERELPR